MLRSLASQQIWVLCDFLIKRFEECELRDNLQLLDVAASTYWAEKANKDEKFYGLVEKAEQQGWTLMLAFCALGEWIPRDRAQSHGGEPMSVLHFTHHPLGSMCVKEPAKCYS
jgi:hypothetical protein